MQEDPDQLDERIQSLLKAVSSAELLLTAMASSGDHEELSGRIRSNVESALTEWLHLSIRPNVVAALLALPVHLTRQLSLPVWLECLADLAGKLEPDPYGSFTWPDLERDSKYRGIFFSLDQLVRHFDGPNGEDSLVAQFLSTRTQSVGPGCSVWFQVAERIN